MAIAAVFLPLLGAFIAGFFGRLIGDRGSQIVTCTLLVISAVFSVILFTEIGFGEAGGTVPLFTWIDSGTFDVSWALRMDTLTAIMLVVVNGVSSMVHIYSVGYMSHDPSKSRFMAYLSLFTFMMLMLVTADNLLQMFFGWEGVGLASYLLINFWYEKKSANDASMKAFLVNRVGDFGFALGIMAIFVIFGTIQFDEIFARVPELADLSFTFLGFEVHALTTACILLFIGAMGKSAQLGLHTWLPDAMEGPTPVSALIHAATMVTAGVFMLSRMSPVFEYAPDALAFVTVMGALTAIAAATIGMTQFDIKRVIAYSTMSQLGYMFFAIGVGAYPAAVFHLMTHAFFKALLFLGAGSVIHAMSDEQDMRNMGGIWRLIPVTYGLMWIGNLALAGIIPFAGYYSKDMILEVAYADHSWYGTFAFWIGLLAALLTAFYSWRLLLLTFHGQPRANERVMAHVHESPLVMLVPLFVLAIGALFSGYVAYDWFVGHDMAEFWGGSIFMLAGEHGTIIEEAHHVPGWVPVAPLLAGILGIALAYVFYMFKPDLPGRVTAAIGGFYRLVFRKYYFDELYNALFVRPAGKLGYGLWKGGDEAVIDAFGPDGAARLTRGLSVVTSRLQTGYVYHYAFVMVIGVVLLVGWFYFAR
ncbi:NADH-quinone oxidoreductase subunit L [Indioceanicola profundi]|uniref:NADH-quinone oxidoreductase subunit L n=1 Tax=Indioceanicola profundi TaxID=2220096 RepID=UPI000E6AE028|nr:NADH-quinone oxidoreductase subunit L [Indioceanicola profundi]